MSKIFLAIYEWVNRHKIIALSMLLLIIAISGFFASKLRFSEDITKILPDNEAINNMNFVYSNSKFLDKVVFNLSFKDSTLTDPATLSNYANSLVDSINSKFVPELVQSIDLAPGQDIMLEVYDAVYKHLPIFLDESDYLRFDSLVETEKIKSTIAANYTALISPASFVTKSFIAKDPLHLTPLVMEKFKSLNIDNDFEIYNQFFISKDKKNIVFLITPTSTNNSANNTELFDGIDLIIEGLANEEYDNIRVDYFGNPVVALGNANQIKDDIIITITLAILVLILVISIFFRSKRTFFIVFLPVAFGAIVSLAFLFILKKEISAISLGIGAVLLGICVDFALHIYSHFREHGSHRLIIKNLATPVILSSLTTAAAFLSLYFVNSEALNDLGLFAAVAIISSALFSLIVLPHLMGKKKDVSKRNSNWLDIIANYDLSRNKYLKLGILLLTIILYISSKHVGFDADMMKNNYMSDKLKDVEKRINEITNISKKTIYIVAPGNTIQDALVNNELISEKIDGLIEGDIIQNAAVVNNLFPSVKEQENAIKYWNNYWANVGIRVMSDIEIASDSVGFRPGAFHQFSNWISSDFKPVAPNDIEIINKLFLENYIINTDTLSAIINVIKVNNSETEINLIYEAFNNMDNAWVIDKRLITSEFVTILKDNFNKLVIISLSLVFLILLIAYGRIELTIITMIPIVFSWIWTVGIMGFLGIDFNIFNVIILTFIFGLGIDYSIFIMRGLLLEYKYGIHDIKSYKISVILSGITTLLGIGVLIFAKHPALRSIATMSIIGIVSVVIITFTLLPAIFKWLVTYKKGLRNRPITLVDFLFSMWALFVFVSGSIILSILSLVMIIVPIKKKYKKIFIHKLFRYLTWFMIYMNFVSKKVIINPNKEDYKKPAIIIANHQSHIDLMLMMLLNYRVVVLTNPRNFRNPIYGPALRYAGFIEVDGNYESILAQVKQQTDEGYSVVVYPEGHRSEGGKLRRFHKGAFYLASELNLDILPIIIYGQKEALKKSEFFLKRATAVTKFLPRIKLSEGKYGNTSKEQARNIKSYFEKEYFKVARELETPDYFNDFIKKNFIYKGPVLEWYTKIKLRLENNYNIFNELIPKVARVTDLGCGYGYLALSLNLVSKDRDIIGIDYDPDKISVATHCAIKSDNVDFIAADISEIELEYSDVFILNDVLHYMPENIQINVINSCISKLNEGGKIIIRDANKDLSKRHTGTRITEFLSTNIGFNKTIYKLEFVSQTTIEDICKSNNRLLKVIDNTKLTSNLIYIIS